MTPISSAHGVFLIFEYEGQTVFMAPASGFYTTPGSGINEVRIAYVLKKEDLTRALFVLSFVYGERLWRY